jgi:hypothetical protein
MKQKISLVPVALLLIFTIISCNKKDGTRQPISSHKTESHISGASISSIPTGNVNTTEPTYITGGVPNTYNLEEPGNDRSLYVLGSILFASMFFRIFKMTPVSPSSIS